MSLACENGIHKVSLVPRPFGEGKEKGPGEYSQQMCQYLPEPISVFYAVASISHVRGVCIITKITQV